MARCQTPIECRPQDLVDAFVVQRFPTKAVVVVHRAGDYSGWCDRMNLPRPLPDTLLFFLYDDVDIAIGFCNSIPDGSPYAVVYHGGIVVHENT